VKEQPNLIGFFNSIPSSKKDVKYFFYPVMGDGDSDA
jgi:hypothetical protein